MIICFDLDDTLYSEIEYVKSGFNAIGIYLNNNYIIEKSPEDISNSLIQIMNHAGRGKVLDKYLKDQGIYSKNLVKSCISIYRKHYPTIELNEDVLECIEKLNIQYSLYLVTDGNLTAQRQKIKALRLHKYFKKTLPTHQYGVKCSKPSTYVFKKICTWEGIEYSDLVYIGDNPNKDFINLKKLGSTTIRIKQGMFQDITLPEEYMAHHEISNINELYKYIPLNEQLFSHR